jgi:signal transduction histidine kinase
MTIPWMRRLQRAAGPRPADLLFAVACVGITQAEIWVLSFDNDYSLGVRAAASLLTLTAAGSLAFRRTNPMGCFWVNAAAVWAVIAVGYPSDFYQYTNLVALYSIAARGSRKAASLALPASVGGVAFYFVRFPFDGDPPLAAFVAATWVVGWLAGRMYGARLEQAQLRAERDVARQLADANEERLAHTEERNRIARELHDIIGHTVNVMVVHAGAGRRAADSDPGVVRQAFETIEQTGRAALSELDRVLALLRRDDPAQERPTPGLADLKRLAETFTDTGLRVGVDVSGDPVGVPASVALAAYRIVQEALTNTMKHAHAASASVNVGIADRRLDLRVADDGVGDPSALQPGRGIRGMNERAAMHGGSVSIARDGGGLVVTATLAWEPAS